MLQKAVGSRRWKGSRGGRGLALPLSPALALGLACGGLASDGPGGGFDPLDPGFYGGRGGNGVGGEPTASDPDGMSGGRPGASGGRSGAGGSNDMPSGIAGIGGTFGSGGALGSAGNDGFEPEAEVSDEDCQPAPMSINEMVVQLENATTLTDPAARRFIRYISIGTLRTTCSAPTRTVARVRRAVSKLVNSLSRTVSPVPASDINGGGLLLRIDLRDYGWDRNIEVNGVSYGDGWEAIVAHTPMAQEFTGADTDALKEQLGTAIPWLLATSFVAAASASDVYYAFTGAPATLVELKAQLGIVPDEDLPRGNWRRAGFSNSGVSRQDRGVARYDGGALGTGFFWQTFDYAPNTSVPTLFLEPLTARTDGTEVLYTLANGLPAYYVADGAGRRVNESALLIDPAVGGPPRVMASCGSCHNAGLVTFTDAVRAFVDANIAGTYTIEEAQRVRDAYPPTDVMESQLEADSTRLQQALVRAGQPEGTPDPVSRVVLDYHDAVGRELAASELYVLPEVLDASLARLPPALSTSITANGLSRAVFEASYRDALCSISEGPIFPVGCR